MILILLMIAVFIIGMFAGAIVLSVLALNMDKKEKNNGSKEKISTTSGNK